MASKNGYKSGKEDGYKSGIKDGTYALIKKMLKNGENIEKIKLYSGCSLKEINKIRKKLNLS